MELATLFRLIIVRISALFYSVKRSKVIFYHDLHSDFRYTDMSTPIKLFRNHIKIIQESGYDIVSEITNDYGQIEICFDDAFLGLYENIDFIKKHSIPIHLFVVPSYVNKKNYINSEQLLEMGKSRLIKISSHTYSHKLLNRITDKEVYRELEMSKEYLENLLCRQIDSICFPEGKFNHSIIHIAEEVGYKKQYSSIPGFFFDSFGTNIIKRSLVQFAGEKEFRSILRGGDHILAFWYRIKHYKK